MSSVYGFGLLRILHLLPLPSNWTTKVQELQFAARGRLEGVLKRPWNWMEAYIPLLDADSFASVDYRWRFYVVPAFASTLCMHAHV